MTTIAFAGAIHEFPGLVHHARVSSGALWFAEDQRVRLLLGGTSRVVAARSNMRGYSLAERAAWLTYERTAGDRSTAASVAVERVTGEEIAHSDHPLGEGEFAGERCGFLYTHDGAGARLRIVDASTDRLLGELKVPHSRIAVREHGVYGVNLSGKFWGANLDAKQRWNHDFKSTRKGIARGGPVFFEGLVIAPLGERAGEGGLVVAVDAQSGKVVWQFSCGDHADFAGVCGAKVLVAAGGRVIVLDAATGAVLVDQQSGLAPDGIAQTLWSDGDLLFAVGPRERKIRVFDAAGRSLATELTFPEAYAPIDGEPIVSVDGRCYLPVTSSTANPISSGVLELQRISSGKESGIHVPEWPVEATVLRLAGGKPPGEYLHIGVGGATLEDVLRYAAIALQSRLNAECLHRWSDPKGSEFNGRILLSCDVAETTADARARVVAMIERVNEWARVLHMTAPNDRKTQASVELAPISDFRRKLARS